MTPTTLAAILIKHCLETGAIVDLFQLDYNINPSYWVIPVTGKDGTKILEVVKK
jgi:hypothetical protein